MSPVEKTVKHLVERLEILVGLQSEWKESLRFIGTVREIEHISDIEWAIHEHRKAADDLEQQLATLRIRAAMIDTLARCLAVIEEA